MPKRVDLNQKIDQLRQQRQELDASLDQMQRQQREQDRKDRTRRKILVGEALFNCVDSHLVMELAHIGVMRSRDRQFMQLAPQQPKSRPGELTIAIAFGLAAAQSHDRATMLQALVARGFHQRFPSLATLAEQAGVPLPIETAQPQSETSHATEPPAGFAEPTTTASNQTAGASDGTFGSDA